MNHNKIASGAAVSKLMKDNSITVDMLADKMGITRVRVRKIRKQGISMRHVALDFFEGITGSIDGFPAWLKSLKGDFRINNAPTITPPIERFMKKVVKGQLSEDPCWIWEGGRNTGGYGTFNSGFKNMSAHKFSYEYHKEKVPNGRSIGKTCGDKLCVNPDHMFITERKAILKKEYYRGP